MHIYYTIYVKGSTVQTENTQSKAYTLQRDNSAQKRAPSRTTSIIDDDSPYKHTRSSSRLEHNNGLQAYVQDNDDNEDSPARNTRSGSSRKRLLQSSDVHTPDQQDSADAMRKRAKTATPKKTHHIEGDTPYVAFVSLSRCVFSFEHLAPLSTFALYICTFHLTFFCV